MFLTRFRVNTARAGGRRFISSPQTTHAAVMSAYPALLPSDQPADADRPRVLWRLDATGRTEITLYIASPVTPDLTHLVEQAGWPHAATPEQPGWQTRPYSPFLQRLAAGSVWNFRLTANPVHHIRRVDTEPRKRTAHRTPHHQMDWLLQRQDLAGFRVVEKDPTRRLLSDDTSNPDRPRHGDRYALTVHGQRPLAFTKHDDTADTPGRRRNVKIVTATFDGRLEITDPDAIRRTLTHGLGKAKAYGCGLMTLAPAA